MYKRAEYQIITSRLKELVLHQLASMVKFLI